ncbi:zinc finger protein 593-like [Anneissia japonica]|uniref:zinc finger protein 593-like n=2 Tax=Anneissia japonica TaxID=1529436 RepID=UPI001425B318|nr:zinc finger protein 593-like [Anneissia japonica]
MTRIARKKQHRGYTHLQKKYRTRRKTKDLDQIHEDLELNNKEKLLHQTIDYDKPGSGQFYCLTCARYFISKNALHEHFRTKLHKRRLKALQTEPYTEKEAEAAAGMGSYHPRKQMNIKSQEKGTDESSDTKMQDV